MKIEALNTIALQIKQVSYDFFVILGFSFMTNFWSALKGEFTLSWYAHLVALLMMAIIVHILKRWLGEQIDEASDMDFEHYFPVKKEAFEALKNPEIHIFMYRPNISGNVYSGNRIKIVSRFLFIKTYEVLELTYTKDTVTLTNIDGKYESSIVYSWDGFGIIGHWKAKPKGLRRAMGLIAGGLAKKIIITDFNKYVGKF